MNKIAVYLFIAFFGIWVMKGCFSPPRRAKESNVTVNVNVDSQAKDGLDLTALIELVKKGKSAKSIEKKLNNTGGINNLDLNEDGEVDFIKVTEYGNKKSSSYGFSFTVEVAEGEEQEIAEIEIEKSGDNAEIIARGNEQVYGSNHHYRSRSLLTDLLIWRYLITPHPFYYSHWGWGRYPGYYRSYAPVSTSVYRSTTRNVTRNSNASRLSKNSSKRKSSLSNPNRGSTANKGIKKSLSKPTSTQKKFQTRNKSKSLKSGGFGKKTTSKSTKSGSLGKKTTSKSTTSGGFGKKTTKRSTGTYNSKSRSRSSSFGGSGK